VVIDEFGPVELSGRGWRTDVDRVIEIAKTAVLLVVRRESAAEVCRLYADYLPEQLAADDSASVETVLGILRDRPGFE
jgi:nucleoside-triphosphatase THEP1